jgi:hypothetical protein
MRPVQQIAAGVKVLLRADTDGGEWETTHTALNQADDLTLSITELQPWMNVRQSVQAIVLGDDLSAVFETKLLMVDESNHQVILEDPDSYTEVNRRRHQRIITEQTIEWSPLKGVTSHVQHSVGRTRDISTGGLRFVSTNPPFEDQEIVLALLLPVGAATGFARCLDTLPDRANSGLYISRLEFMWSHPASQDRLRDWVDSSLDVATKAIQDAEDGAHLELDSLL